ncbi:MAG: creatininase family protein [Pseudomonadota bacterium]
MRLDHASWPEVEAYLQTSSGILLPVGSTEQHGPIGLIGTDAICAQAIAEGAADRVGALVAPTLSYTPAPFNTGFPGTVSVSEPVFEALFAEVVSGLCAQGFERIYVLNGHGANLAPMRRAAEGAEAIRIRSWWDFEPVNALRQEAFGPWEGMHATPSEVAITQALGRTITHPGAETPPRALSPEEMARRAGDRHGPPDLHRREFPDGRVGSHSALATPELGRALLQHAVTCVAADYEAFAT